mgnify:CR=1 FL=1
MRPRHGACPLACILCAATVVSAGARIPGWEPFIDQPIGQLEEILETLEQQQPMNYTISNICILYDAKLYILFDRYLDTLEPGAVAAAVAGQALWLDARADSVSIAASEYAGGSLSPYVAGMRFIEVTKNRIDALEEAMEGAE